MKKTTLRILAGILCLMLALCSCKGKEGGSPSSTPSESENSGESNMSPLNVVDLTDASLTPYERSVITYGDPSKVAGVMKKAERGEDITICVLGGSITQGAMSSSASTSWAGRVKEWFVTNFPSSDVTLVNAGIGATDSVYGVFRLETDVLAHEPDLVVLEFCVNDRGVSAAKETYESIIRRLILHNDDMAIISLATSSNEGSTVQDVHTDANRNYHIPFISFWNAYNVVFYNGDINVLDCYSDALHPNDKGHGMLADLIKGYLDEVKGKLSEIDETKRYPMNPPVTEARYMSTAKYGSDDIDTFDKNGNPAGNRVSGAGWTLTKENPYLKFSVSDIYVLHIAYQKSVSTNAGAIKISVNGFEYTEINSAFPGGFGNYTAIGTITDNLKPANYEIEIELMDSDNPDVKFWLNSIMIAKK